MGARFHLALIVPIRFKLYCDGPIQSLEVDHFIAWSRYPLDLGHNFVAADSKCNGDKCDRLPALPHLVRWKQRNGDAELGEAFDRAGLPHDLPATTRVAAWAYRSADEGKVPLWLKTKNVVEPLPGGWRDQLGW